jgi:hypothetical protein
VTAIAVAMISSVAQAGTTEVVLNQPGINEHNSSVADGYLVWTANTEARPSREDSYVMAAGGPAVRINPAGTHSHGAAIDGTTIVYEEATREGTDLWFFDAVTQLRAPVPDGVNTPKVEYRPSLSGDWLLFTRSNINRARVRDAWYKVVLYNVVDDTRIVLVRRPWRRSFVASDQVNGDWATFESCGFRRGRYFDCQVFRYQISTEELVQLSNPGVQQYAGGVSSDGTVYLVRTRSRNRWRCGHHTTLVRMPVGGPKIAVAVLPDGRDALTTFAFDEMDGSTTMYFDRINCRNGNSGIFRIPDAYTAGLP